MSCYDFDDLIVGIQDNYQREGFAVDVSANNVILPSLMFIVPLVNRG